MLSDVLLEWDVIEFVMPAGEGPKVTTDTTTSGLCQRGEHYLGKVDKVRPIMCISAHCMQSSPRWAPLQG